MTVTPPPRRPSNGLSPRPSSWQLRSGRQLGRLLDEKGHRRGAQFEGERTIGEDGDHHRYRGIFLFLLRLRVERLAEFHDVEAALTKRGSDRGRRVRRTGRHLQFQVSGHFLCHLSLLMLFPDYSENFTGPWCGSKDDWRSPFSSHGSSEASPLPLLVIAGLDPAIHLLRNNACYEA